jgi:predicted AAA+ superfamily ATPase
MVAYLPRYIENSILEDVQRKMVFIGGPRQAGKTTLSKHLCQAAGDDSKQRYLNWDATVDRERLMMEVFPAGRGFLILDEIHKFSRWRQVVKGLFDKRGDELQILVTGSASLDYYRRGGDSLQGRYHFYRLLPLTYSELGGHSLASVQDLLRYSGFPEPFLLQSERQTRRWSREYRTRIVRGDLTDLEKVQDVSLIEMMALRLPALVGKPLSLNALKKELQVSHQSVARWLNMLENLYMLFRIPPFGAPSLRAVKKEVKHYHWDWTVVGDMRWRFENLIACHLLKWCYFLQDTEGRDMQLRYFRDVDRREVDFVLLEEGQPLHFIDCDLNCRQPSRSLNYLKVRFPRVMATQVVLEKDLDWVTKEGIRLCSANHLLEFFI